MATLNQRETEAVNRYQELLDARRTGSQFVSDAMLDEARQIAANMERNTASCCASARRCSTVSPVPCRRTTARSGRTRARQR
jgi:hypothetical protein